MEGLGQDNAVRLKSWDMEGVGTRRCRRFGTGRGLGRVGAVRLKSWDMEGLGQGSAVRLKSWDTAGLGQGSAVRLKSWDMEGLGQGSAVRLKSWDKAVQSVCRWRAIWLIGLPTYRLATFPQGLIYRGCS